jgi:hypothetical protein
VFLFSLGCFQTFQKLESTSKVFHAASTLRPYCRSPIRVLSCMALHNSTVHLAFCPPLRSTKITRYSICEQFLSALGKA